MIGIVPYQSFVLAFVLAGLVDMFYTLWMRRAASGHAREAAAWAAMVFLSSGAVTLMFVRNWWLLLAATAGAALGTYLTVRFDIK